MSKTFHQPKTKFKLEFKGLQPLVDPYAFQRSFTTSAMVKSNFKQEHSVLKQVTSWRSKVEKTIENTWS